MDPPPICDPVLHVEVFAHGLVGLSLVAVVARSEPADVAVRGRLVVIDLRATVDAHEAVAVGDHHAHPRVGREVPILEPALRAVHDDVVALDEVPHHREMRRSIGVASTDHGEALLFEEPSLLGRELSACHALALWESTLMTAPLGWRTKNRRTPQDSSVSGWTI